VDILDAYSTTKNKTVRSLFGGVGSDVFSSSLASGLFPSTASITSLDISTFNTFATGTRISLYGIKG
jgi:surface protein